MIQSYSDFQITRGFHIKEFHCKNGVRVPPEYLANCVYLATQLQKIKDMLGNPTIIINSGYRTIGYNNQIGGSPNSRHTQCRAADIRTQKYTPKELFDKIKHLIDSDILPKGELIRYPTFVHYAPDFVQKFAYPDYHF